MNLINIIKIIHIIHEIFLSTYIFIFNKKYDIYFVIYIFILSSHWIILKNECILSYIEKKLMDKNYKLGVEPYNHPYYKELPTEIIKIFNILKLINILYVAYRNIYNKYILILIFISFILIIYSYNKKFILDYLHRFTHLKN
jgi:hypothetical protein